MSDGITLSETLGTITIDVTNAVITSISNEPAISVTDDTADIIVSEITARLISDSSVVATVVRNDEAQVVAIAEQGPQGPPGTGDGQTSVYRYGETISALKPVVIIDGEAFIADSSNTAHRGLVCGITTTAASAGNNGTVRFLGAISDDSWNWTGPAIFIGPSGTLVETPPASGFSQVIARVESSDTIFIEPGPIYERD